MKVEQYFKDSCVRGPNGELLPVYHGTTCPKFTEFIPDHEGNGSDQYGGGMYFSTSYDTALGYAGETTNSDSRRVLECYLNITRPLIIDGIRFANLRHYEVSGPDALQILYRHSGLYLPLNLGADAAEFNPMIDYIPDIEFSPPKTKQAFRARIRQMAKRYFDPTDLLMLDCFFGKKHGNEFRRAVQDVLGFDGIRVDFETQSHYIAWFPEQAKLTTNENPTLSSNLYE